MYYDDVELCNPIGNKAIKHKLGLFYITLYGIDAKYRSRLQSIRLMNVVKCNLIQHYGIDLVLEPFYEDLRKLNDGVLFNYDAGNDILVKGGLLAVVGDTLASHLMGGFKGGVGTASAPCRECCCTHESMQEHFDETEFIPRNLEKHKQYCEEINKAETQFLKDHLSKIYGINHASSLVDLPYFDVTQMLPQDIMHIMLEGVIPYEIQLILQFLARNDQLDLNRLNRNISTYPYGYFDKDDKPNTLNIKNIMSNDPGTKFKQSASQTVVLLKILPMIMAGLIPSSNEYMALLIELLEIYHILSAPFIAVSTLTHLRLLIKSHLIHFKNVFEDYNIIPKQHYMCHFPSTISKYGPPNLYSCMRWEGKHKMMKRLSKEQNFIDIAKTVASQYQRDECLSHNSEVNPLFSDSIKIGPILEIDDTLHDRIKCQMANFGYAPTELVNNLNIQMLKHATVHGTKYIPKKCFLIIGAENGFPEYGRLNGLYLIDNTVFLELDVWMTHGFDKSFQAYEVGKSDNAQGCHFTKQCDLLDFRCYDAITISEKHYITIEHSMNDLCTMALNYSTE